MTTFKKIRDTRKTKEAHSNSLTPEGWNQLGLLYADQLKFKKAEQAYL